MTIALILCGTLAIVLLTYLTFQFRRYPHLRRMAWRNLWTHKTTSILTGLGLAVSTSLIAMTLLSSASMERGAEAVAVQHFGRIAYDMPSTDQPLLSESYFLEGDIQKLKEEYTGDLLPVVAMESTLISRDVEEGSELYAPKIHVIGADSQEAARFDPALADIYRESLKPDELILSEPVADNLGVVKGDRVYLMHGTNREHPFWVADVVPERGLSGYRGILNADGTVLASLETTRGLAGIEGSRYTNLLLSERAPFSWISAPVRSSLVDSGREASVYVTIIFGLTSLNAVIIGIVLITNIFRMLAEERRQEMGILRAIGLGRRELKVLLMMEGLLFGIFSGLIGTAFGLGLAWMLIRMIGSVAKNLSNITPMDAFRMDLGALMISFSIGLFIVFLCVWIIARKAEGLSIVQALHPIDRDMGPTVQSGKLQTVWLTVLASIVVAVYLVLTAIPDFREAYITEERIPLAMLLALMMIPSFTILLVRLLDPIGRMMQVAVRGSASMSMVLRLAFRNMTENKTRTGLLIIMFAAVSCFISLPAVYHEALDMNIHTKDPRADVGGFDLIARVPQRLDSDSLDSALKLRSPELDGDAYRLASVQQITWNAAEGEWGTFYWKVNGIDAAFAGANGIPLLRRDARFAEDREVWLEAASNTETAILSQEAWYRLGAVEFGDTFELRIGGKEVTKRLIGIAPTIGYHPEAFAVWVSRDALPSMVRGENEIHSTVFIRLMEPNKQLENTLRDALAQEGVSPVMNILESEAGYYGTMMFIIRLFQYFNQFALIIGMFGLMTIMYRLIRQRRRQLSMLRAIGVRPSSVYGIVLAEGALIGVFGIALGFVVGSYASYVIFDSLMSSLGTYMDLSFRIPYGQLGIYFAIAMISSLALSCLPAMNSLRIRPSEASRNAN
jgi:putative ABC transport system permease protein